MNRGKQYALAYGSIFLAAILMLLTSCPMDSGSSKSSKSNNASLTRIVVSEGTLSPAFSPERTSYTLLVDNPVSSITVVVEPENLKATITISPAGSSIPLTVGETKITITVTAENKTTVKVYTLTVTRSGEGSVLGGANNEADFGVGAVIANTFTVSNAVEWGSAVSAINSGGNSKNYVINVTGDFSLPGRTDATFTPTDIKVSIRGEKTITLSSAGNVLNIITGQSLILRDIQLHGFLYNDRSLVYVGGDLTMKGKATIADNTHTYNGYRGMAGGGGVYVDGGIFTMQDSTAISGNTITDTSMVSGNMSTNMNIGGGVYVDKDGYFVMEGEAVVSGNIARSDSWYYDSNGNIAVTTWQQNFGGGIAIYKGTLLMRDNTMVINNTSFSGGGVWVDTGAFTMQDNTSISSNGASVGGGVEIEAYGSFTMENQATIAGNTSEFSGGVQLDGTLIMKDNSLVSDNTVVYDAGGVGTDYESLFIMEDSATVTSNTAGRDGGGVYFEGTFEMKDYASVSNNTAGEWGGGVVVGDIEAIFSMKDNTSVSNNSADEWGGGVYVHLGTFTMEGGEIADNTARTRGGGVYLVDNSSEFSTFEVLNATVQAGIKNNKTTTNSPASGPQVYTSSGAVFTVGGIPAVPDTY